MTTPQPATTPGRRKAATTAATVQEYTTEIERAEVHLGNIVTRVLTDYLKLIQEAAKRYESAVNLADKIWNDIEGPARRNYERQVELADHARTRIMDPAKRALDEANDAAQRLYTELAQPAEQAYADSLTNAQSILSSLTING